MIPSDRSPGGEPPPQEAREARDARDEERKTLPPPEWTSRQARVTRSTVAPLALERRTGPRAEEAWMRARVHEARASGDKEALRATATALARWLASRDRDLDEAVELATQALHLAEDVELRREVAAWLESLGEAARAAVVLRPIASLPDVESAEAGYVLVRTGVLKARAGAAAGAVAAFEAAVSIDPDDALPAELLGAVAAWDAEALPAADAARAYVEAARRRAAQDQADAELEDLWRARAIDPTSEAAGEALARALERRQRGAAADEARRVLARSLRAVDPEAAARVDLRRRNAAMADQDPVRALGAALDASLDCRLDGDEGALFDTLLLDLGMLEALAARLAARAQRASPPARRVRHYVELSRLYSGPLADESRSVAACVAALAADPTSEEAIAALRAQVGDAMRALDAVGDARPEPVRSLAESLSGVDDEGERRARIAARARRAVPSLGDVGVDPEPASEAPAASRAASAAAWVRAVLDGDAGAQAAALERVALTSATAVSAVLLTCAGQRYESAGRADDARRAAELATRADPMSARSIASLADALAADMGRPAAAALERAIGVVGPRAEWCASLARALDGLGELALSVGWSQRLVALRPGDREAIERLVDRLLAAGDAGRLGDALAWLLSQPHSAAWLNGIFSVGLRHLAKLDVDRAAVVARRALEVFGPKWSALRETMLEVGARASDDGFVAAVLERWLACGAEGTDRAALYARLIDLREHLGDEEGEARLVARALREGLRTSEIDAHKERLLFRPLVADALVWRLWACAEAGASLDDAEVAVNAWRDLGAALWDLAEDRVGAIAAWRRAARLTPSHGHVTMALDLAEFGGTPFAFEYLARLIETEPDAVTAAAIAADVARAALRVGEVHLAFDLAARGLSRSPSCADALEVAERAADRAREHASLSALYDLVANRALGRFGRRAAHHRGARFFERRGENALALKHAAQAFYAVPSEGSSFQLLARAAERAGDRLHAVRTLEHVAEGAKGSGARAGWLLRAASIAGEGEEGARRRVDVLLRAAVAAPSVATIALLTDAAREVLRFGPEERDVIELRVGRAARTITDRLDGPDGARIALAFTGASLELFSDADGALGSIERAFASDGDVDEYAGLVPRAPALALASGARDRVARMLELAERPHSNVGVAALRLFTAIATALGDSDLRARASIAAASRDVDDDALVIEADASVRAAPELAPALAKRVSPARRAQALLASARTLVTSGAHVEAAPLFERAVELVEGEERAFVERELRATWDAAGRGNEIEARVHQEAASDTASPATRADRWTEIAERREARGDRPGAVRAQSEACKLDPEPLERWSALERLAELAEDDDSRVLALEQIAKRVTVDGRVPVFKRLCRAHERRGDLESALRTWHLVLALDPEDEAADQAIEAVIVARGRYDELADHLARRAERLSTHSGAREVLRAVRLRRAAILEQRLGRLKEACDELALLLNEWPDNVGALRYLADLLDRQGDHVRAAPLWRQAAACETNVLEREVLELRAGRASAAAGDPTAAAEHASRVLARNSTHPEALALKADIARAQGADRELADSLDALATSEPTDPATRADLLVEAAQAAARTGDSSRALDRARRAAELAPERATPQLLARALEYRTRGAGTPSDARKTIEDLACIRETLVADDEALRAFLLAEALDAVQGGGAGMRELEATRGVIGLHPLVALGLAERLVSLGQHAPAVEAYRVAVAGPLLDLRHPASVALAASDAALRAGRINEAAHFLDLASGHPGAQEAVRSRRERLSQLVEVAQRATLAPGTAPRVTSGDDRMLADLEAAVRAATSPGERARARLALGRARLEQGDPREAEPLLWEALADGLSEAGDLLAPVLASAADRARDLVRVRWQQVSIEPGDVARLESLRAAAVADDDRVYARAVEHVLRAFDPGAGPLPPPPLAAQPSEAGMLALLTRPASDPSGEALALLWEGATQLFARDAASYGITGVERVVPGNSSVIARLYEVAMRVLESPRIPLFVPRMTAGAPIAHVAVLSPPSVILSGDVREETPELRFALGRGMAAAMPQSVLRLGLPPAEARALLDAMQAAFGPPEMGKRMDARAARLAESFWQIMPARAQRRLQELLGAVPASEHPGYEDLVARAHQAGRRVGLFLSGDFAHAVRVLLTESASRAEYLAPSLSTLRPLCDSLPAMADLLRVAVSPEYAQARWHAVAPAAPRGTMSSGRFSLF
jgi:tetratricopeptide (TPR) repeat protein